MYFAFVYEHIHVFSQRIVLRVGFLLAIWWDVRIKFRLSDLCTSTLSLLVYLHTAASYFLSHCSLCRVLSKKAFCNAKNALYQHCLIFLATNCRTDILMLSKNRQICRSWLLYGNCSKAVRAVLNNNGNIDDLFS